MAKKLTKIIGEQSASNFMQLMKQVPWRALGRWWIVGLAFTGAGLFVLYVLRDVMHMPLVAATSAGGEVTLLVRFLINDRWVFGHQRPTWTRLWKFHVAGAGGGAIWWFVANLLPRYRVHYLLAATAGTACSVIFTMATNFLWIWRTNGVQRPAVGVATAESLKAFDTD
jgi:putative flippase GtrA